MDQLITATEVPFVYPVELPRTGIHVSDIIKDLLIAVDPKTYGQPITKATHGTFQRGYAWEDFLKTRSLWAPHIMTQVEFELDGITGTLDGFDARNDKVYESKATFKSMDNPILGTKFIGWRWQMMAYCKMAGCYLAHLDVLFVNGNWAPPQTVPRSWEFSFAPQALQSNWDMIRRHKDRMVKAGKFEGR